MVIFKEESNIIKGEYIFKIFINFSWSTVDFQSCVRASLVAQW